MSARNNDRAVGHYHFGTQTYNQGRGKMHSKFSYFGPSPDYEWFDFTLHGQIRSVSPNNGSIGGGQVITVTGDGFNDDSVVTIGQDICEKISFDASSGEIVCRTPTSPLLNCNMQGKWFQGARGLRAERYPGESYLLKITHLILKGLLDILD